MGFTSTPSPWRCPRLLALFVLLLPCAFEARAADDVPKPESGRAAATTLALLEHQRDVCDTIAGRVRGYWPDLAERPIAEQQVEIREFVLDRQLSDLAASRATSDLVDRFMPTAARETTDETSGSLRRLAGIAKELCDVVALPAAPQKSFDNRITGLLDRFEIERVELGRLMVVSDEVLASALEPYLGHIQLAGVEAEGEYLAYLESIREKPKEPTMADLMRLWHQQIYSPAVEPSKQALASYLKARSTQDVSQIGNSCRALAKESIQLLRRDRVFKAPDERVTPLLKPIFFEMRSMATQCTAGRQREVDRHFSKLQERLQAAADFMKRYGLRP